MNNLKFFTGLRFLLLIFITSSVMTYGGIARLNVQAGVTDNFYFSRFYGGSDGDSGWLVEVDHQGNIIVSGQTSSTDLEVDTNLDPSHNGGFLDVFLAKFNPSGDLIWSTYVGGSNTDLPLGLGIDNSNNIIISGRTESNNFPTTLGAYDENSNGLTDVFVSKFNTDGELLWSTYMGGSDLDFGQGLTVGDSNQIFITGETHSDNFPVTQGVYDETYNGGGDAFVAQFSSNGSLDWSTYLGGNGSDSARGIDSFNPFTFPEFPVIVGNTQSLNFPLVDPIDSSHNGGNDLFVSRIIVDGEQLVFSTYIGGSDYETAKDIAVGSDGRTIVVGDTRSNDFPIVNAYDANYGGSGTLYGDGFIVRIGGSNIIWSTYLGGSGNTGDSVEDIVLDGNNNIYVTGSTESTDFPVMNAIYPNYNGGTADAFVMYFLEDGSLIQSTFLGGDQADYGHGITLDSMQEVIVTGSTASDGTFPITLSNYGGGSSDAFVSYLNNPCDCTITVTSTKSPFSSVIIGFISLICLSLIVKKYKKNQI